MTNEKKQIGVTLITTNDGYRMEAFEGKTLLAKGDITVTRYKDSQAEDFNITWLDPEESRHVGGLCLTNPMTIEEFAGQAALEIRERLGGSSNDNSYSEEYEVGDSKDHNEAESQDSGESDKEKLSPEMEEAVRNIADGVPLIAAGNQVMDNGERTANGVVKIIEAIRLIVRDELKHFDPMAAKKE